MAGGVGKAGDRSRAGKFKKPTRGGGKHFSRDLQPVDADGNQISIWAAKAQGEDDDDDDDEDSSEEDDSSDDAGPAKESTRDDRKAQKKARKEAAIAKQKAKTVEVGDLPSSDEDEDESEDDDMPANPNHTKAARKMAKAAVAGEDEDVDAVTEGVSKLPAGGSTGRKNNQGKETRSNKEGSQPPLKTDVAKADLARLKLIREQREADAALRAAEKEERDALAKEKALKDGSDAREAKMREAAAGPKKGPKKK